MASYDNEIYRGPPEAGPTLEHDLCSYGSDVYIVKAEKNTLAQDVPPTEEPVRQEAKPVQKKESKIAKAMKLLASCTAAVTVAATLSAPVPSTPAVDADLPLWPGFSQVDINSNSFISAKSKNGHTSQFSVSGQSYCLKALQENLYMLWYDNDDWETAGVYFKNTQYEKWRVDLDFSLTPSPEALGTIQAENGDTLYFYFREGNYDGNYYGRSDADGLPEPLQNFIDNLSSYIRVTDARADGWGKVFIGDAILSDTGPDWNGVDRTDWHFQYIHYASEHGFDSADALREHIYVNDIEWSVYYAPNRYGDPCIWCVPSHEDLALGVSCNNFFNEQGISPEMQEENPYILNDLAGEFAEIIINEGLIHYRRAGTDTDWDDVTQPPADDPFDDSDYFHAAEFSLGGHSFRMDSMQDDVSIRHFYTGPEESEEFDLWFAGDDTHVKLVLSTDPEGKEFYEYAYPGFDPVYYALYSWSDHPMSASELDTLAYDIPNYINLTELTPAPETTAPPETTVPEPTLPEPYPEMEEYIQYYVSYDMGLHHTELARSNRVCQFVTDRGNYRLRAKVPEIFVCTEDYYYDVKEEMSNSRISIHHYEEGWRMEAWVFNEPVDSVYQGFSMIAEDGSELWFYVSELGEEYDLFSIIGRLSSLVTLSTANDDDWGKVRIGDTLISHNNQYWNGTAYTVNSYDFWYFEQILDSHALSGYDLQHAGQRVVNGITWDFYTLGSPSGYPNSDGLDYYFTEVYVVCGQEDIWLKTSLSYGLSPSNSQFANRAEYEANLDREMGFAIDTIVRTGLSNYYPYP